MREHETSAPSLGEVIAALDAAEIQECHVNGDKADVISAPPGNNCLSDHRLIARCSTGPLWIKQAVAIAKALNFVRSLAAAPPTAMAEAVASARAEGVREGLERAAGLFEAKIAELDHELETGLGPDGQFVGRKAMYARQDRFCAQCDRDSIRALIPGGRSDV